jgi:uncharacterized protein (DUF1697 family)
MPEIAGRQSERVPERARRSKARHVALLRGINIGTAKRVAMADLRGMLEDLGYANVRTLLNSGNVVFDGGRATPARLAAGIEKAMATTLGVSARVFVLTASDLEAVMRENTLAGAARDPSRLGVAFYASPTDRSRLALLARRQWKPEVLALGSRAAYMWCPGGFLTSRLPAEVGAILKEATTTRNWATVQKLHALATAPGGRQPASRSTGSSRK